MKKKFLLPAVLTAITALACTNEPILPTMVSEESVELTVSIPGDAFTKASSAGAESAVGRLQVFVFRASDGALEATASSSSSSLTMSTTTGRKTVAALVNAQDISVTTFSELESTVSDLKDNSLQNMVMYGRDDRDITADAEVNITVTRQVAKIVIQKITNDISQPEYASEPMSIDEIFVLNAAGNALISRDSYSPTKWYNFREKEVSGECDALLCDVLSGRSLACHESLSGTYTYYCYANPTAEDSSSDGSDARFTRLVVKATIAGRTAYYPMSIENIEANHVYTITELKITRLGSDDPDVPVTTAEAAFTVTVADWEDGSTTQYTI